MLSRKKTKNEVSKPAEVQGKYVKKETSPLLRSECRRGPRAHTWPERLRGPAGHPGSPPLFVTVGLCEVLCSKMILCLKCWSWFESR